MDERGSFLIHMDGRWSLEDLYIFPRTFEQVYFALGAFGPEADERLERAFSAFPWQGGYSAVNFYNQLRYVTPAQRRPAVAAIHYASPGWMELTLLVPLAISLSFTVRRVAGAIAHCNDVYNKIYRNAQERKLLRMEVESKRIALAGEELAFVLDSSERLARVLDLSDVAILHERTQDPLISLKVLMSLYRRVRVLAEFHNRGKVRLLDDEG